MQSCMRTSTHMPARTDVLAHVHRGALTHARTCRHAVRSGADERTHASTVEGSERLSTNLSPTWGRSRWKRRRAAAGRRVGHAAALRGSWGSQSATICGSWCDGGADHSPLFLPQRCWGSRPQGGAAAGASSRPETRARRASPEVACLQGRPCQHRCATEQASPSCALRSVANDANEGCCRRRCRAGAWGAMAGGDRPRDARILQPRDASFVLRMVFCVGQQMLGIGLLLCMPR